MIRLFAMKMGMLLDPRNIPDLQLKTLFRPIPKPQTLNPRWIETLHRPTASIQYSFQTRALSAPKEHFRSSLLLRVQRARRATTPRQRAPPSVVHASQATFRQKTVWRGARRARQGAAAHNIRHPLRA
jgi:hypothetical protein